MVSRSVFLFLFLFFLAGFTVGADDLAPRLFSHPDRIRYDNQCLTIDGKDILIYSGAFHYFRCPKELWRDRFQKIKDAGFNTVESYAPWNWHERAMPASINDYSQVDLKDLDDWLAMAEEFGFYVIIRPGPYICAEWDSGGFPQWLMHEKPAHPLRDKAWLRSDDPVFLTWAKHWYDAVCPVIAKHQITRRSPGQPGVILMQLENEYDFTGFPASVMLYQIKALAQAAQADGIDVPFITCWTRPVRGQADPSLRQIFDACNFYPRWDVNGIEKDIHKARAEQPDAPLATTELQGGWYSKVGGKLSEDQDGLTDRKKINNLTLFALQNGETILNYYMLCGGLNPPGWEARGMTTTYDYNAPIREWGRLGERYERVRAIGQMLSEHGARLARTTVVDCQINVTDADVTVLERRAQDGARYFFVRTSQRTAVRCGTARVRENDASYEIVFDYKLEPFGAAVFYLPPGAIDVERGQWLLKVAQGPVPVPVPKAITLTTALRHEDNGPSRWEPVDGRTPGWAGIDDNGYVFYGAHVTSAVATNLLVEFPEGDTVSASINGQWVLPRSGTSGALVFPLAPGTSDIRLLYENHGHANSGAAMERPSGILAARLTRGLRGEALPIGGWRMHRVKNVRPRLEIGTDFDDEDWPRVNVTSLDAHNLVAHRKAVFRARINLTPADLAGCKKILTFGRIDDLGWIYVNGKNIGETKDWSRSYSFDVTEELHPGRNSVAVVVENDDGAGGLGAPGLADDQDSAPVALEMVGRPAGVEGRFWKTDLDERGWKTVAVPDVTDPPLLTWYRIKFALPPSTGPRRLHLNADGNGFLYLNGHPLGRYWQSGPQHDFYLPECWLNCGADRSNVLAVDLRSTDQPAAINSASVEFYP